MITGDAANGFTITNTHAPETISLSGVKTWDDAGDQEGRRPSSITVRLYADGEQAEVMTVDAEDGWAWRFENLPKYTEGREIRYTITEDRVPGYQSEIDGMNVINHYTPNTPDEADQTKDSGRPGEPKALEAGAPRTGDTANPALWMTFLAISGTGLTAVLVREKRKRRREKYRK